MNYVPPVRPKNIGGRNLAQIQPLPRVPYEMLDPGVRYLWMVGKVIFWIIVSLGASFLSTVTGLGSWLLHNPMMGIVIFCGYGFLALTHILWSFVSYPHWGYALRETDLLIRSGVLWKDVIAVPFNRIQHVDSQAGPLTRSMGMAQLVIHTAGSQMGSVSLPGLPSDRAEALRDYLSQVGHSHANI